MNIACYIRIDAAFEQVRSVLARAGFTCERYSSETTLLRMVRRQRFAMIMVDIGTALQDCDGIFSWLTCRSGDSTPVVVFSPSRSADLAAAALDAGADDFLPQPVEPVELVARVRAILRRCDRRKTRRSIELAGFSLDRESSTFAYQGNPIELTPREFTMAWLFFSSPGVYISRETIGAAIWGTGSEIAGRTIEQHVYKLRKKLELGPDRGVMIRTAYSQGYRLEFCGEEREMRV